MTAPHSIQPAAMRRAQAAEYLGISTSMLDDIRRRGDIDPVMIGTAVRYLRADLDEYLASLTRKSAS